MNLLDFTKGRWEELHMKKGNFLVISILLVIIFLCSPEQAEAKKKVSEKPIKQEWGQTIEQFSYPTITIEKDRAYSLDEILKIYGRACHDGKKLRSKLKKGMKPVLTGKGLLIKKSTIKADKTGEYKLKMRDKNVNHLFRLRVMEKDFKVELEEISQISICLGICQAPWDKIWFHVSDSSLIKQITEEMNRAGYTFSSSLSPVGLPGAVGYDLYFFDSAGNYVLGGEMFPDEFCHRAACWRTSNPSASQACYDLIDRFYKDRLSQMPEWTWEGKGFKKKY